MKAKLEISCGFCRNKHITEIELPDGFETRHDTIYEEQAFCPNHVKAKAFLEAQCPGCVASWPDCGLGKLRDDLEPMTEFHTNSLKAGYCPARVNGTFSFGGGSGIENLNLSDRAPAGSGVALVKALEDHRAWNAECRKRNEERNKKL